MPIIMFNDKDIVVIFDNTFVADTHEGWFDPAIWMRVAVNHDNPREYNYDKRGDGYVARFDDASIPTFITAEL